MIGMILNSGIGKRLEELTKNNPKCLVKLYNDETILERQLRILKDNGISRIIITTGPFEEKIIKLVNEKFPDLEVQFINNPLYETTNYIYSIYLAKELIIDDILLMHGDLVFNSKLISEILKKENDFGLINKYIPLPEKDFKAVVKNEKIEKVGIEFIGENCFTFMPVYKMKKETFEFWLNEIENFVNEKNTSVYAENAFNKISNKINISYFEYSKHYCKEIDDKQDLQNVNKEIEKVDKNESKNI